MATTIAAAGHAAELGVVDALIFRRVGQATWAHVGGLGRGQSWAGIIEINAHDDPLASQILSSSEQICRHNHPEPMRVLGPYYAASSAVIRLTADVIVVLGSPDNAMTGAQDSELLELAHCIDAQVADVAPSKRLADEVELLTAVKELMSAPIDQGLDATQKYLTTVTMMALTCEIGVARDAHRKLTVIGDASVSEDDWHRTLDLLAANVADEELVAQDMTGPIAAPLARILPRARAFLLNRSDDEGNVQVLMIHTADNPRGFSTQCLRMCQAIIETGTVVARTAALRDELRETAAQAAAAARTDPLTGLGNRLAWDEAVGRAQEAIDRGEAYSVVSVDVDGLKIINDRHGHAVGDDLLRRCAAIIRAHCSERDLAVRMGGDEFMVLVPREMVPEDPRFVAFARTFSALRSTSDRVAASIGVAVAGPGDSLFDAIREADMAMYSRKRQRRRERLAATATVADHTLPPR